ncbi:hypothetical protein A2G96_18220 [Cupriavidus nantongensis]|uniref:dTDP-4-dehydrorhamnose 3,5-epimerase n=1 Tax=Cupriavidus nantongensis TaxID=1796606 RepID=A0A142JQM1_9BURK|nr:hypothetical protein A2G96_18220 [Cupriavidus nantongensis]
MPAAQVLNCDRHTDKRGYLQEIYNAIDFTQVTGTSIPVRQVNHTFSHAGVLRGIHIQLGREQGKLVRVLEGRIFDVAVDLRAESPNFGKWAGVELDADSGEELWVPPGFGHGFLVLGKQPASVLYLMTCERKTAMERSVCWNDPSLGIAWPLSDAPILSDRDLTAGKLSALLDELRAEARPA